MILFNRPFGGGWKPREAMEYGKSRCILDVHIGELLPSKSSVPSLQTPIRKPSALGGCPNPKISDCTKIWSPPLNLGLHLTTP
jgi:hypothetical protein